MRGIATSVSVYTMSGVVQVISLAQSAMKCDCTAGNMLQKARCLAPQQVPRENSSRLPSVGRHHRGSIEPRGAAPSLLLPITALTMPAGQTRTRCSTCSGWRSAYVAAR